MHSFYPCLPPRKKKFYFTAFGAWLLIELTTNKVVNGVLPLSGNSITYMCMRTLLVFPLSFHVFDKNCYRTEFCEQNCVPLQSEKVLTRTKSSSNVTVIDGNATAQTSMWAASKPDSSQVSLAKLGKSNIKRMKNHVSLWWFWLYCLLSDYNYQGFR